MKTAFRESSGRGSDGENGGALGILAWIFHYHGTVKMCDVCRRQDGAIGIYEKEKDRIDMVILDMVMPGMGGGETLNHSGLVSCHR